MQILPQQHDDACLVGRVWSPVVAGPCLVKIAGQDVIDITSRVAPTMSDLLEMDDPATFTSEQWMATGLAVWMILPRIAATGMLLPLQSISWRLAIFRL